MTVGCGEIALSRTNENRVERVFFSGGSMMRWGPMRTVTRVAIRWVGALPIRWETNEKGNGNGISEIEMGGGGGLTDNGVTYETGDQ